MGIKIDITNNIPEVQRKISDVAKNRMMEAVNTVRNTTLETLSGTRSGRQYYVPGTHKLYTASAPGEPPAVATGRLRQSIKSSIETEDDNLVGYVGTDMEYGKELEYGRHNMEPRPWLRPSFEESEQEVKEIFAREWL
jgi:phage gpG-like protein